MCNYSDYVYESGVEKGKEESMKAVKKAEERAAALEKELADLKANSDSLDSDMLKTGVITMYKGGTSVAVIAATFGVEQEVIEKIING